MKDGKNLFVVLALFSVLIGCQDRLNTKTNAGKVTIVMPKETAPQEQLAAKEIRRYLYLRTGELLPIVSADKQLPCETDLIVIGQKDRPLIKNLVARDAQLKTGIASLQTPEYKLKTIRRKNRNIVLITGADTLATLYGAYHFIEHFGVRYYLHGDTIPDERITLKLPDIDKTAKPLFDLRGVNPWGTHPFGFDLWNADDYKSIFSQLTKMRMNFLGLHCYPEGLPYAEPTVWIGLDGDFDADGDVKFSYPAVYYNTLWTTNWGPFWPKKTSDFSFGGSLLFDRDDWGADVMTGLTPQPTEPEKTNQLFNRTGRQFKDSFEFAKSLGVKTCVGTEAPLTIPKLVREKLIAKGKDPKTPEVKRQVYESIFKRIMATHPLDYYWIWTSEAWLWSGNTEDQSNIAGNDFLIAHEAMKNVNAPFSLATAGWVLGPQDERSGFDRFLPKDIAVSTLSQLDSHLPINPDFDKIKGRGKWPIIWMEDDLALSNPQLWVGRTRKDAAEALAYGCSGLMGLHWRTRAVSANISAMAKAKACWDQSPWNPTPGKVPAEKFLKIPSSIARQQGKLLAGAIGGNPVSYIYVNPEIANTDDDILYTTARYGMEGYNIEVPNGTYRVTLQFSEPQFDAAGKRVFSVKLQDKTVIDKLDIFAQAGKSTALDYTFEDVKVTDG